MDCIYIACFYTLAAPKALYNVCLSFTHSYSHSHIPTAASCHARCRSAHQEQLGVQSLIKDTSAHGLGGVGDRTANLAINRRPSLPPEPQP